MHMWMWFGYDLGEFVFSGLSINTRWSFALTWIIMFFVAMLFEGSKIYLASVQRESLKKLHTYRSDERRNLLCDREQGNPMEPTTSRNTSTGQFSRWASLRIRALVNTYHTLVYTVHNTVGYLLMLAVMAYNVQLIVAVVLGMMLGYFLFGAKLTRLQMQCFGTKRVVICTPECDDNAETTPPLLGSPGNSESDIFTCQTRNCIQPSHYFRASTSQDHGRGDGACHYGARQCPAKVAKTKTHCQRSEDEKANTPDVDQDTQLLQKSCCSKPEPEKCCQPSQSQSNVIVHEASVSAESSSQEREASPQITCCHKKSTPSGSQEQIVT